MLKSIDIVEYSIHLQRPKFNTERTPKLQY
jgi:hypothetical protein